MLFESDYNPDTGAPRSLIQPAESKHGPGSCIEWTYVYTFDSGDVEHRWSTNPDAPPTWMRAVWLLHRSSVKAKGTLVKVVARDSRGELFAAWDLTEEEA